MDIRQRLMLGFGGLLSVIAIVGILTMFQLNDLGKAIDVVLKENYRSVIACQDMKESLERMDSGILYTLSGKITEGNLLIDEYALTFSEALKVELGNITLPNEHEKALQIEELFKKYLQLVPLVTRSNGSIQEKQVTYFSTVHPMFIKIKSLAQDILVMNQTNIIEANNAVRIKADTARKFMLSAILISAFLALLFSYLTHRWILYPINRLIESTNEIRKGNLDLVLDSETKDEIGWLSESMNEMVTALRQVRKEDRVKLIRTKRATEEIFKALPAAIAVFDMDGKVEVATETADRHFGLKPGVLTRDLKFEWLIPLIRKAVDEDRIVEHDQKNGYIQQFVDNREYFFQPMAIPIPSNTKRREQATGVALILKDVTQLHEQEEMKRGVVCTVSHQLKTPLTSLRMCIHLLLEERIGTLNEKQTDLLMAARDDSERLVGTLNNLMDINRIESGKSRFSLRPIQPRTIVRDAIEPFIVDSRDKGVTISNNVSEELPEVIADAEKIHHVFANLITNALRFTAPGGTISIFVENQQEYLNFHVEDTGQGIPEEDLPHIFEQFYRGSGQKEHSGVGLGLSIVKEIIRAHEGDVHVKSQFGKGTIFSFSLPVAIGMNPK
ncbi:MAG: HAMP domain-containing protein [Candidatus Riflebacteria bacterium]|nr:HAMP domain-containing protein [Candidatus Riflebacteria bacterium]